jgi:NAD(P)-dependent dehydrogenase (short-subunit alcohol dehydrogenase family)
MGRNGGLTKLAVAAGAAYLGWQAIRSLTADEIAGEVVLITGGSRGLGLLMAREFAAHGCSLVLCARDELELERARLELEGLGARVLVVPCDVADRDQVEAVVARATEHFGRVDVLVNNAGIIQVGPVGSMTIADYERAMDVMFWGSLHATLAVLPQMQARQRGRIVNITSIGGKVAVPHLLPYVAAKFAHVGLSEGMRAELAKEGVTVTTIVPGLMRTGSPVQAYFKGDAEKEFTWFSLSSATPLTTMSGRRAARRIVAASRRGEALVTLTWQAKLLGVTHGLFPGATADLLGLVNRLLPDGTDSAERRGMHLATSLAPSPLTALMNRAARRNNEFGGRERPTSEHAEQIGLEE